MIMDTGMAIASAIVRLVGAPVCDFDRAPLRRLADGSGGGVMERMRRVSWAPEATGAVPCET